MAFGLTAQTLGELRSKLRNALAEKDQIDPQEITMHPARVVQAWPSTPYKNQVGYTCGLYALRNVMRYHFNCSPALALAPQIAARKLEIDAMDRDPQDSPALWVPNGVSLRELTKRANVTAVGELLHARYVAQLAAKVGYRASWKLVVGDAYATAVKNAIDRNVPVIVSVDVGHPVGNAAKLGGKHGHWVVAFGYQKVTTPKKERELVFVMHWGRFVAFPLRSLQRSSNQLDRYPTGTFEKQGNPNPSGKREWAWRGQDKAWGFRSVLDAHDPSPERYVLRARRDAIFVHLTDVSHSLNGAIVEVEPETSRKNTLAEYIQRACATYRRSRREGFAPSANAAAVLEGMIRDSVGLNVLLDAVLYYTNRAPSARPNGPALGSKLVPNSKLDWLLRTAYDAWEAWMPTVQEGSTTTTTVPPPLTTTTSTTTSTTDS